MVIPNYHFIFSKSNIKSLCAENMNFYQAVFPEKTTHKKGGIWDNYGLIFTLSG